MIEDEAIQMTQDFTLYSAFQRFSRVKAQANRYVKVLQKKKPVYLFGLADAVLWKDPNLFEVTLEEPDHISCASFTNNWFVVLYNPNFTSLALVTRELNTANTPSLPLAKRTFEGFWTTHPKLIRPVVEILNGYINQKVKLVADNHNSYLTN